jgi:hypothetical protein
MAVSNTFAITLEACTVDAVLVVLGVHRLTACSRSIRMPIVAAYILAIGMAGSKTSTPKFDASIGGGLVLGRQPGTNCGVTSSSIKFCAVSVDCRVITLA